MVLKATRFESPAKQVSWMETLFPPLERSEREKRAAQADDPAAHAAISKDKENPRSNQAGILLQPSFLMGSMTTLLFGSSPVEWVVTKGLL